MNTFRGIPDRRGRKRARLIAPRLRYYYEVLKIHFNASPEEIKRAYRRLARIHHPDKNPDDSTAIRRFQDIQAAYEAVSKPETVKKITMDFYQSLTSRIHLGDRVFDIGSFFGLRNYRNTTEGYYRGEKPVALLETSTPFQSVDAEKMAYADYWLSENLIEEETSVLDDPAWDIVEIMLGGRYTTELYKTAVEAYTRAGLEGLEETPWYEKNLDGFYAFVDMDFVSAGRCFAELCEMIPNNIIFLYRHGLALEAYACTPPERGGPRNPARKAGLLRQAAENYRMALDIIAGREGMERMQCITIRKALADCLEHAGKLWQARHEWKDILHLRSGSIEAKARLERLSLRKIINPFHRHKVAAVTAIDRKLLAAPPKQPDK